MFLRDVGICRSAYGVTTQKTNIDIFIAVRTADLILYTCLTARKQLEAKDWLKWFGMQLPLRM
jgi:hypothetical protein